MNRRRRIGVDGVGDEGRDGGIGDGAREPEARRRDRVTAKVRETERDGMRPFRG